MPEFNRRNFLKASGLTILPALIPAGSLLANDEKTNDLPADDNTVYFYFDGKGYEPTQYLELLQQIDNKKPIERDFYGAVGVVAALEKRFEEITGKEKSIFMPTGTMANQLAIAVLSGENTKIFVQDTSHVYRDEADAAQSVFQKRLMPLAKDETYFTAEMLKQAVDTLKEQEVFASGVGAISIENPVRRSEGRMVPIEEIRKISEYCKGNNIKMHLDGARIYMASAWSGVSVKEYASYFDTIYISLYKYLGAAGGAVLSGEKKIIDKMQHLVKIHGGTMYSNWTNAAMALHRLDGLEDRLKEAIKRSEIIFPALNKMNGMKVTALDGGTNIYDVEFDANIDVKKLNEVLSKQYGIRIPRPNPKNKGTLTVNDTLLSRDANYIIDAFKNALKAARGS